MSSFEILGPDDRGQLRPIGGPLGDERRPAAGGIDSGGFAGLLTDAVSEVRALQREADDKAAAMARGEPVDLHDLMISMSESEVAFNLMLEVRNKLLEAWQTLSRTTV